MLASAIGSGCSHLWGGELTGKGFVYEYPNLCVPSPEGEVPGGLGFQIPVPYPTSPTQVALIICIRPWLGRPWAGSHLASHLLTWKEVALDLKPHGPKAGQATTARLHNGPKSLSGRLLRAPESPPRSPGTSGGLVGVRGGFGQCFTAISISADRSPNGIGPPSPPQ